MRDYRLVIVMLFIIMSFGVGAVIAQEATEEPGATEPAAEVTEVAEETETPDIDDETPVDGARYVVQVGDNLFRIALRFGLTTAELAEANGITNPSLIVVGQTLIIPGVDDTDVEPPVTDEPEATEEPETTPESEVTETPDDTGDDNDDSSDSSSSYVVQAGDNLFRIAVQNNTTVATLLSLNPSIANPNVIFVGQRLNLPDGSDDGGSDIDEGSDDSTDDSAMDESTDTDEAVELDVDMSTGVEIVLGDDYAALASLTTQLGVDWVKITADWRLVEPEEGEFNFDELDAAVNAFDNNFNIILLLTGAPNWSRPSATELALEQPTYGPPDDLSTFGTFASEVAGRYAGRVDAYEIWYQPNNRLSWMTTDVSLRSDNFPDARLSDVRYVDLLEVAYNAIQAVDQDTLVLTAGLAPTGNNDFYNSIDNFIFFEELLRQGALNFSDGVAIHVDGFSNAPDAECCGEAGTDPEFDESYHFFFGETIDNYREILDRNGGTDQPLLVTRFGWGTTENASGDGSELGFVTLNTADEQADYITQALILGNDRGDIGVMILHNLNGCASNDQAPCYYSLIDNEGAARSAFSALAMIDLSDE